MNFFKLEPAQIIYFVCYKDSPCKNKLIKKMGKGAVVDPFWNPLDAEIVIATLIFSHFCFLKTGLGYPSCFVIILPGT